MVIIATDDKEVNRLAGTTKSGIISINNQGENMKGYKVSVDLRIVCAVLLVMIAAMLVLWRPWQGTGTVRTIDVTGEATIEAEPDEFVFYPSYQKKGTDKATLQQELATKVNEVIAKLKEIGVDESDITLSSNSYDNFWTEGDQQVTSNSLTVTVTDKELSQRVQDYLLSTTPDGQATPIPSFSKAKEKQIQDQARSKALEDAKKKAETTASELGVKIGRVVTIDDSVSAGGVFPMGARGGFATMEATDAAPSYLPVLPGKQEVQYNITVTYELK